MQILNTVIIIASIATTYYRNDRRLQDYGCTMLNCQLLLLGINAHVSLKRLLMYSLCKQNEIYIVILTRVKNNLYSTLGDE